MFLEFGERQKIYAGDFLRVEADRLVAEFAAIEQADFIVIRPVVHAEFDERLKSDAAKTKFFCQPAHSCLMIRFSCLHMLRDGAIESKGSMNARMAALLNQHSAALIKEQDVNAAMPEPFFVDN